MSGAGKSNGDLEALWMPFTANRQFKATPRLFESARGMYYRTTDGRELLDSAAGLWCCNAGHCHPKIVEAIRKTAGSQLVGLEIFDRYEGEGIPEGKVSLAFRMDFQRPDRTLNDVEVTKITDRVMQMLSHRFGYMFAGHHFDVTLIVIR